MIMHQVGQSIPDYLVNRHALHLNIVRLYVESSKELIEIKILINNTPENLTLAFTKL